LTIHQIWRRKSPVPFEQSCRKPAFGNSPWGGTCPITSRPRCGADFWQVGSGR
jgi:hypothetical protein